MDGSRITHYESRITLQTDHESRIRNHASPIAQHASIKLCYNYCAWGCQVSTGDSEATDAYRGPCTALSSLENTIANSELALAA